MKLRAIGRSRKSRVLIVIAIIILALSVICYKVNRDLSPVLIAYCDYEARTLAMQTINQTILDEFEDEVSYDDLMNVKTDSDGRLVMLQADTMEMNKLAAKIALDVQKNIKSASASGMDTYVPLGIVLKNDFFAYMGPKIRFRMEPAGTAFTSYRSEFEAAGINQTRHIIYIDVSADIFVIVPLYRNSINVTTSIPIAESVIMGNVPESYTDIKGFPYLHVTPTPVP